jgi:Protein of unknown function (DUF3047)
LIVRSGEAGVGRWWTETRNVYDDYRQIHGEEPPEKINVVSIAVDSNDTRSSAESYIGEIFFRSPGAATPGRPAPRPVAYSRAGSSSPSANHQGEESHRPGPTRSAQAGRRKRGE